MELCSLKNNLLKGEIKFFNTFEYQIEPEEKQIPQMIKLRIGRFQQIITIFVWVLIFIIPLMFGEHRDGIINWDHIIRIWIEYGIVFLIFLINRMILLPHLYFKNKRIKYFISLAAIFLVFGCIMYVREVYLQSDERERIEYEDPLTMERSHRGVERPDMPGSARAMDEQRLMRPPREFIPPYANLFMLTILLLGFDTGLKFSTKWLDSEQTKIKLEKENVENKMAFLQNQISPHFFMNTLNNIHALVDISTEEAKEAIIKLSRMMGYMLYESKTDKVPLKKEMEFITSYIELMKIRFTDEVEVELVIPEVLPPVSIPPLLTISYIENAFKHGISYTEPSFVRISFSFEKGRMTFDIINKVYDRKTADANSGVGVENARKRLELIYGKNYKLEIGKLPDDKLFAVNLNVPL